jgi:hypothetical protein
MKRVKLFLGKEAKMMYLLEYTSQGNVEILQLENRQSKIDKVIVSFSFYSTGVQTRIMSGKGVV